MDDCRRSFPVTCTQTMENPSLPICDRIILKCTFAYLKLKINGKEREKLEISFHVVAYEMSDLCEFRRMWKLCECVCVCVSAVSLSVCSATQLFDSLTQFQVLLIVLLNL